MYHPTPIILSKYGITIIIQKVIPKNKAGNPCYYYTISENNKTIDTKLKRKTAIESAKKILENKISLLPEKIKQENPETKAEKRKASASLREPKFNFGD